MNVANNIYSCYKYVRSHIEKKHILHFLNRPTEKDEHTFPTQHSPELLTKYYCDKLHIVTRKV